MGKSIKAIIEDVHGTDIEEYKDDLQVLVVEAEDVIEISEADKKFMENFKNLLMLSIVSCKLKNLNNLPDLENLERIELSDNNISGGLKKLASYTKLRVIKLGGCKIKKLSDIEELKPLSLLENIDLGENPVVNEKDYSTKMWEFFPNLKVLDGVDKEGNEYLSEDDEGEYDGEGEGDLGDFIDPKDLTEEQKKELEKQGIVFDYDDGEGEDSEEGEDFEDEAEGEDEGEDEEEAPAKGKRKREEEEPGKNKRQKTDE